ncbi:hypothetical protein VHP8226_03534 [Vibrio hippocampi]|uniref:Uncharacterized protein n=1 Tax=Vibrio hippocampi TaxID=654686 RepID=A0ABN8DP97_9VIBR|nr:hypothetical protein VHP8226_03534 [Vibrio hippocampi]
MYIPVPTRAYLIYPGETINLNYYMCEPMVLIYPIKMGILA